MENQNQRDDAMNGVLKSNLFPTVGKYNLDGWTLYDNFCVLHLGSHDENHELHKSDPEMHHQRYAAWMKWLASFLRSIQKHPYSLNATWSHNWADLNKPATSTGGRRT